MSESSQEQLQHDYQHAEMLGLLARVASEEAATQNNEPTANAVQLFSRVLEYKQVDTTGLGQADIENFFKAAVFPAIAQSRQYHNSQNERKVSQANISNALTDRFSDMLLFVQGLSFADIASMNGRQPISVRSGIDRALRLLRYPDSPYGANYFQAALADMRPDFKLQEHSVPKVLARIGRPPNTSKNEYANPVPKGRTTQQPAKSAKAVPTAEESISEFEEDDVELEEAQKEARETQSPDSVRMWLKEIGKVALLNAEEEVDLAKQVEAGLFAEQILLVRQGQGAIVRASLEKQYLSPGDYHSTERLAWVIGQIKPKVDLEMAKIEKLASSKKLTVEELESVVSEGGRAKKHLEEANLRLVVSLAKRYTGRGMAFLDLIQEGNLGMIRAVEKFDYKKGYKFSTYGTWWIRQAISRAMADQARTIRIPVHMVEGINKLGRTQREMLQALGRGATPEELAEEMDITPDKVLEMQGYAREPASLDQAIGDDGDGFLGDFIEDPNAVVAVDAVNFTLLQDQLQAVLQTLNEREAGVIKMRYGLTDGQPRTLDEIGQVYGVTRERIRQIEAKTMKKLRHPSRAGSLRDYLE